jgi:hypothetical protein
MSRIFLAVLGFLFLSLASDSLDARQEPSIDEQLQDVRKRLDAEYERVGTLQNYLDEAERDKNETRVEHLRKDIDQTWKVIEELKELEEYLVAMVEKRSGEGGRGQPKRSMGIGPFDRDTSTGTPDTKELNLITDEGLAEEAQSREELEKRPKPKNEPSRPDRAGGAVGGNRKGDPAPKNPPSEKVDGDQPVVDSPKLRQLKTSYDALVAAGEDELAERTLAKIHAEEKRLLDELRNQEREERAQQEKERRGQKKGNAGGGGPPLAGTDEGPRGKSAEDRLRQLEERLRMLEEENKRLKEGQNKDDDGDRR